ncbi:pentatricopeptide repeat-containing protein At5g61990, mitochondrial [Lactuca sativa]|uniref:Pentacotripeptide-repeat region of PRORP domain-containing protein n=1 Tax=Lactuca sativa TaxID=4236 RepID=A0A9R1VVP0_LACSA|nr:pentatricopeptide repeat-containing protein At5g61990, mitochondrial [Lactuca sativa]KAJ0213451.1 hypothetical protein LSAT_V11C400208910 [Lactuca sativa]
MMNTHPKKLLILRFLLNPIAFKTPNPNSFISSTTSSFLSSKSPSNNHPFSVVRFFSVTSEDKRPISDKNVGFQDMTLTHALVTRKRRIDLPQPLDVSPQMVSQVIDVVRSSNGDCGSKLDSMGITLSKRSVCEIFRVLSCDRVPGLKFFEWVRDNNPDIHRSADVCSLMIDNCGWLGDYDTMKDLLMQFKQEGICLTDNAFAFLPVLGSSKSHAMESISLVIQILNEVGGSIRSSGVFSMIHMLCVVDSFELAKFVMEVTEKKLNYYAIIAREKCRRGHSDEAYALLGEMRMAGCEPDSKIYNYILGSLCKNDKLSEAMNLLKEMKEAGVDPDPITFEVIIANSCRSGKMEFAKEILRRLLHMGHTPRLTTHAAFVKGYFDAGKYEEAYEYVRDIEVKKMPATNKMYGFLARIHQRKGNIDVACRILDEMMEKGLKPDYRNYKKIENVLRHTGGRHLAQELQNKFSKFRVE